MCKNKNSSPYIVIIKYYKLFVIETNCRNISQHNIIAILACHIMVIQVKIY